MKSITVLKLGGSLITDKEKPHTPRRAIMKRLAREIQAALKEKPMPLLIGNGSGSFGHYAAQTYQYPIHKNSSHFSEAFAKIQQAAARLNRIVVDELVEAGVPAISVHPSSFLVLQNTHKKSIFVEQVTGMLSVGIVPVIYGDILFDTVIGAHIYSTEQMFEVIITELIKQKYSVSSLIQATVVPGILDRNKEVLSQITRDTYGHAKSVLYTTKGFDVTGGMLHKIELSLGYAQKGITTHIISGLKPGLLQQVLMGKQGAGTVISQ